MLYRLSDHPRYQAHFLKHVEAEAREVERLCKVVKRHCRDLQGELMDFRSDLDLALERVNASLEQAAQMEQIIDQGDIEAMKKLAEEIRTILKNETRI